MEWLNENAGLLIIITAVAIIALSVVIIIMLDKMIRNIAVQRLKFLGFYSADVQTREKYAELTIGNKSLNDVGLSELGIRNGKVNFDLTKIFKEKRAIAPEMRIVVEQRSSVSFTLSADELRVVLVDGKDGKKKLGTLYLYAVDLTGNLYKGRIGNVRKLLAELLAQDKAAAKGTERTALSFLNFGKKAPAAPAAEAEPATESEEAPVAEEVAEEPVAEEVAEEPVAAPEEAPVAEVAAVESEESPAEEPSEESAPEQTAEEEKTE